MGFWKLQHFDLLVQFFHGFQHHYPWHWLSKSLHKSLIKLSETMLIRCVDVKYGNYGLGQEDI